MSLSFKALAATSLVSTMADTDNLVLVNLQNTSDPKVQRISLAAFKTLVGGSGGGSGGGGGGLVEWDGFASEAPVPLELVYDPFQPTPDVAELDASKTIMSMVYPATSDASVVSHNALVDLSGRLPTTGKYYFILLGTGFNVDDYQGGSFAFSLEDGTTPIYGDIGPTGGDINSSNSAAGFGTCAVANGVNPVILVTVDVDAGSYTIYGGTDSGSVLMPVGSLPAVSFDMQLNSYASEAVNISLALSTDPALSPIAIPAGFSPLQVKEAQPPVPVTSGSFMLSTTDTFYRGGKFKAGQPYLNVNGLYLPFLLSSDTPSLSQSNEFQKMQHVGGTVMGLDTFANFYFGYQSVMSNNMLNATTPPQLTSNVVVGGVGFSNMPTTGQYVSANVLVGNSMMQLKNGQYNVGLGTNAGSSLQDGTGNFFGGNTPGGRLGNYNVYIGNNSGQIGSNVQVSSAVAIGSGAMNIYQAGSTNADPTQWPIMTDMIAIGTNAYNGVDPSSLWTDGDTTAWADIAIGRSALQNAILTGWSQIAIGDSAGQYAGLGGNNVLIGRLAGAQGNLGSLNVGIGGGALFYANQPTGFAPVGNVAIGVNAMTSTSDLGNYNTALGYGAFTTPAGVVVTNSTAIGYNATVTDSHQVQLGNASTTTYVYGTVQDRSDIRDKTDVVNTSLGLDFILALRPVDFRWDMREDYVDWASHPKAPDPVGAEPQPPTLATTDPGYTQAFGIYQKAHDAWVTASDVYTAAMGQYKIDLDAWLAKNDINTIVHDGSKKRTRLHHGFIAQEVGALKDTLQKEFGGWQDHSLNGGKQVQSLGYDEFTAPIVRAIQQMNEMFTSDVFIDKIAARVQARIEQGMSSTS